MKIVIFFKLPRETLFNRSVWLGDGKAGHRCARFQFLNWFFSPWLTPHLNTFELEKWTALWSNQTTKIFNRIFLLSFDLSWKLFIASRSKLICFFKFYLLVFNSNWLIQEVGGRGDIGSYGAFVSLGKRRNNINIFYDFPKFPSLIPIQFQPKCQQSK